MCVFASTISYISAILCLPVALNKLEMTIFLAKTSYETWINGQWKHSHRSMRDFLLEVIIHTTKTKTPGKINTDWPLVAGRRLCICPGPVCWRAQGGQSLWKSCSGCSRCFLSARKCSPCNCCCWDSVPLKAEQRQAWSGNAQREPGLIKSFNHSNISDSLFWAE